MGALDQAAFAALMARFAPFEARPHLAVAVSGGADSLALALLADGWARAESGRITALTVDHRLRPGSAEEAARVAHWLRHRAIAHVVLVRDGPGFAGDVQAEARAARYRLLEGWCECQGVLHLLTAHHREDQAETVLLRLARGSGLDGLAGIAAVVERRDCRILRPLLTVPRASLAATLEARGQAWIEDPSNRDPAYARVRLRQAEAVLEREGTHGGAAGRDGPAAGAGAGSARARTGRAPRARGVAPSGRVRLARPESARPRQR